MRDSTPSGNRAVIGLLISGTGAVARVTLAPAPPARRSALDHRKAHLPEARIAGIEAEGRQQLLVPLGAAGLEHGEILLLEAALRLLVDRVERVHQAVAEGIGVDIERRMDEVRDVGPEGLVALARGGSPGRGSRACTSSQISPSRSDVSSPSRRSTCTLRSNV